MEVRPCIFNQITLAHQMISLESVSEKAGRKLDGRKLDGIKPGNTADGNTTTIIHTLCEKPMLTYTYVG